MFDAWNILFQVNPNIRWPRICCVGGVVRLALALFGEELSPRFCFAKMASVIEWDGTRARCIGQVQLGTLPYPARLEVLAEQRVAGLLCGSFPRERLADATRWGIVVYCGVSGRVPVVDDELTDFVVSLGLPLDTAQTTSSARPSEHVQRPA